MSFESSGGGSLYKINVESNMRLSKIETKRLCRKFVLEMH